LCLSDWILKEVTKTTPTTPTTPTTDEQDQMTMAEPDSQPGLFSAYRKKQKKDSSSSPQIQLNHYLDICDGQSCLQFWAMNRHTLPSLFKVAVKVMAVPASSAPVERVFSHGGVIMRPHRSQLSDKVLTNLIFCKCNAAL